jgi:hypothetical protein
LQKKVIAVWIAEKTIHIVPVCKKSVLLMLIARKKLLLVAT